MGSAALELNTFDENKAGLYGGALATMGNVKLFMRSDIFRFNMATSGGAVYLAASTGASATGIDASCLPFVAITATTNMAGCVMKNGYSVKHGTVGKGVTLSNAECINLCRTRNDPEINHTPSLINQINLPDPDHNHNHNHNQTPNLH